MNGWNNDVNSDKYKFLTSCIKHYDLQILGIAETHLKNDSDISVEGYTWYGFNRKNIHVRAKSGSGGVGLLIRNDLYSQFDITVVDNDFEGIFWLKFEDKNSLRNTFYVCVVYLPPEYSTRAVNVNEFFETLMTKIYTIPHGCPFFICGDWNSRCSDFADSIPGIDDLPDRHVVDFQYNAYGKIFSDFLTDVNCCILNGRKTVQNDFTYISTRGSSVVDYCIIPYELLHMFDEFKVIRTSIITDEINAVGVYDLTKIVPDHSLLCWKFNWIVDNGSVINPDNEDTQNVYIKYDTRNLPEDWLHSEFAISAIDKIIRNLEVSEATQSKIDHMYEEFVQVVKTEMGAKLASKTVVISDGIRNRKRKLKKPWWNDELTVLWNDVCKLEKMWLKCSIQSRKREFRQLYINKRKEFDKAVQKAKRHYWYKLQDELDNSCENPKEFWRKIGKIGVGNERQSGIPMEVKLNDGSISCSKSVVLDKWKFDFANMFNRNYISSNFNLDSECVYDESLDCEISVNEVYNMLTVSKNGKSPGFDEIPVELYKNETSLFALTRIFNICFNCGKVPEMWSKGVITPIPKNSTSDPRDPMMYRGITLAPVSYKLYCGILNARLTEKLDNINFIHDEQNGFRKGRSTIDHLSTLTNIIETRKLRKLSTFVSFIDFKKAYDWINRDLLFCKLKSIGISSKMLQAIFSLYNNVQSCVRINGNLTDWFDVKCGLKQGCVLSPLLFNIFINDLVDDVKKLNVGINIGNDKVCVLLYADDVVFLTENENDLQKVLDTLNVWCGKNDLTVNLDKSKIVHFRPQSISKTDFVFEFNGNNLNIVSQYNYLGLLLTEFLSYDEMAKAVAKSASRSLGLLISKCKINGGFKYFTFTKLFDTLVWSVIEYGASLWGTKDYSCVNSVKNRAMRFFMGVGRYTPNLSLYGDMGWIPCNIKQWTVVFRNWSRVTSMCDNRINKKVFVWSNNYGNGKIKNWSFRVKAKFKSINMDQFCDFNIILDKNSIKYIENLSFNAYKDDWYEQLMSDGVKKLRSYKKFKNVYGVETYLCNNMPGKYKSAFSKFRCGVAPLRIETGRYENLNVDSRVCFNCNNEVEDEKHVLLQCPV